MLVSRFRRTSLPLTLRWVLALLLVVNGSFASPVAQAEPLAMVTTSMAAQAVHDHVAHAIQAHCHQADADAPAPLSKHVEGKCPCCPGGGDCQCAPVIALSLPLIDLHPIALPALGVERPIAELSTAPRPRLLRPPIG